MRHTTGLELVLGLTLFAVVALAPRPAAACSGPMEIQHGMAWTADGPLLALADPDGRFVRVGASAAEVVAGTVRFAHSPSDFTRDGREAVVVEHHFSPTGDCAPESITLWRIGMANGAKVAAGRGFDVAGVRAVRVSPTGARAALVAPTFDGEQVRIYDLARARALRRMPGIDALWLDADRLAVMRESGNVHVVNLNDRRLVQVGSVVVGQAERHFVPGDQGPTGFTFAEKVGDQWSIVRVRLDGARPVQETHAWPRRERPVSISADGGRFAAIDERGRHVVVAETTAARVVATVASSFRITLAALSPDGTRVGLTSHEVPTEQEDDDAFGDASALQPTAVQVIDLAGRRVAASWGAAARITFPS